MNNVIPIYNLYYKSSIDSYQNINLFTKNIFRVLRFEGFTEYIDGVNVSLKWSNKKKHG